MVLALFSLRVVASTCLNIDIVLMVVLLANGVVFGGNCCCYVLLLLFCFPDGGDLRVRSLGIGKGKGFWGRGRGWWGITIRKRIICVAPSASHGSPNDAKT